MATTTFGEFKKKVIRVSGDSVKADDNPSNPSPIQGVQLSAELLMDACHAALHAIAVRQWKSALFEIATEGDVFDLPAGLIEIDSVYDSDLQAFLPKMTFELGTSVTTSPIEGNSWIDTPEGKITFTSALKSSGAKIYYLADWELPVDDSDALECPEFCLTALVLYGASYVFLRKASQQSELAQFKTKVDAGTPEDLPAVRVGSYFLQRFENEMTRIPMKQKGTQ